MDYSVGIDVSLELSSVCVLNAAGQIVGEAKVASDPEALVAFLIRLGLPLTRIGLEAGPLSQWLSASMAKAGFDVVLLKTRQRHDLPVESGGCNGRGEEAFGTGLPSPVPLRSRRRDDG